MATEWRDDYFQYKDEVKDIIKRNLDDIILNLIDECSDDIRIVVNNSDRLNSEQKEKIKKLLNEHIFDMLTDFVEKDNYSKEDKYKLFKYLTNKTKEKYIKKWIDSTLFEYKIVKEVVEGSL